jgi:hypothetical protein
MSTLNIIIIYLFLDFELNFYELLNLINFKVIFDLISIVIQTLLKNPILRIIVGTFPHSLKLKFLRYPLRQGNSNHP